MCGRYTLRARLPDVVAAFDPVIPQLDPATWVERYNVAPSQDVAVVRINSRGDRVLGLVRWGLIPSWAKEKPKVQPINAKSETVATSGMFRQAFARRRCLLPADGFYEWQRIDDPKRKQPMYVRHKGGNVFAFAGLWERWRPTPDADPVDTCTVLTTTPNALMAPIHDRMPVVVGPADHARWLDRDVPGEAVADLLKPYDAEAMEAWPVSTAVNSPKNDTCECVAPLAG